MLSRKEHHAWFLSPSKDRDYQSDMERKFFEAIENPPQPSARLKSMVERYGKYAFQQDQD
jgi:hypothetical protein